MKKLFGLLFLIITSIVIPLLTDSGKEFVFGFVKQGVGLVSYWREILIFLLLTIIMLLLIKVFSPKNKFKMQFEQLWDKDKNLYCKTCKTPVDRDMEDLWCPHCRKEIELFDGGEKLNLLQARKLLR
ncbi:hypothetical protein [Serratia proteamaculans]|uniref:hypothetical protein n=1 Tax=Serratia proteamaculans TaxID=28151 RepID=UPI0021BACECA|nr:hypothetical protein [Serratia proteamaculans]